MMDKELLERIKVVRRDLGHLLFHFAHTPEAPVNFTRGDVQYGFGQSAGSILQKILMEGCLLGTSKWIRGGYRCVCFTEAPIGELAALFSLARIAANEGQRPRYEPYGVAVPKEWLFDRGGRPVVYQPDSEFELLPEDLRYRHVRYEPNRGIDHTWEREWRIKADKLILDPDHALVVVPTRDEAYGIMYDHSKPEPNTIDCGEGIVEDYWPKPTWTAVSLDLFGLSEA
jgi:hypothetical protein